MPVYEYKGYKDGKFLKGVIESSTRRDAILSLRDEGVIITQIEEKEIKRDGNIGSVIKKIEMQFSLKRITLKDLAIFSRQLSSLLRAGVQLSEALDTIARQTKKIPVRMLVLQLSEGIKSGKSFNQVLEETGVFPEVYCGMVRAGEESGELEKIVDNLAQYLEEQVSLRSKILSALIYPSLVIVVMGVVVWILLSFVVPRIANILSDVGKSLPIYTRGLIFFSNVFSTVSPFLLIIASVFFIFKRRILKNVRVRYYYDLIKLKIPFFSRVHILGEHYRIFSTLATLTRGGVPLVKAIEISKEITTNVHIKKVLEEAKNYVVEGKSMSSRLSESEYFPPIIYNMVAVGERSGELQEMFQHIADNLKSEIDTLVATFTSILEPILVVVMGGIVFMIMLSVIVPIFEINRTLIR